MTVRNRWHSRIMVRVAKFLDNWLDQQPEPRGAVLGGEAGCRIRRDPDTTVGIDVVYIAADLAAKGSDETSLIDGVPVLVVEILSPNDTQEQIHEKIADYLEAGVALVWIIDPYDRTVRIYRPGAEPELVTSVRSYPAIRTCLGFESRRRNSSPEQRRRPSFFCAFYRVGNFHGAR